MFVCPIIRLPKHGTQQPMRAVSHLRWRWELKTDLILHFFLCFVAVPDACFCPRWWLVGHRWTAAWCCFTVIAWTCTSQKVRRVNYWLVFCETVQYYVKKGKGSPYSITERRVLELISVLGSQPAGDASRKPGSRLLLLSTRPAVTPTTLKRAATNFAAWGTEAQWVWAVCVRLSASRLIWTRAFCAWVQHANHSATEPPFSIMYHLIFYCIMRQRLILTRACMQ